MSYYHAVPINGLELRHDPVEVAEIGWFAPDELPPELAPPGNGSRIYSAWREAFRTGRIETPLTDRP